MALFDRTYAFGTSLPEGQVGVATRSVNREFLLEELRRYSRTRNPSNNRESPLVITKIRKSSPLTIWFEAMATALVAAVIISGGEVDLIKGKFKVHSLGDGLKKLRDAFAVSSTRPSKKRPSGRTRRR